MLKKILGQAPFEVEMCEKILLSPQRKFITDLVFKNDSEYDLPLSCSLKPASFIKTDNVIFDVLSHAEGKTHKSICFSVDEASRLCGGRKICEMEISDRIFDSKTIYELEILCEFCYQCCNCPEQAFAPSQEMFFSKDGVLFANEGEIISLEIPMSQEDEVLLHIISGKIKNHKDYDKIPLVSGLNRLCFEITQDASFEFLNPQNSEKAFFDTLKPPYFI